MMIPTVKPTANKPIVPAKNVENVSLSKPPEAKRFN